MCDVGFARGALLISAWMLWVTAVSSWRCWSSVPAVLGPLCSWEIKLGKTWSSSRASVGRPLVVWWLGFVASSSHLRIKVWFLSWVTNPSLWTFFLRPSPQVSPVSLLCSSPPLLVSGTDPSDLSGSASSFLFFLSFPFSSCVVRIAAKKKIQLWKLSSRP